MPSVKLSTVPPEHIPYVLEVLGNPQYLAELMSDTSDDIDLHPVLSNLAFVAERAINYVRQGADVRPAIYYCVVPSYDLQAAAFKITDDEYCIALWLGVSIRTHVLAHLVGTEALAKILCYEPEGLAMPVISGLTDNFLAVERLSQTPMRPLTGIRMDIAGELIANAVSFIVYHELGHIINGHTSYVIDNNLTRLILEVSSSQKTPMDVLTRQVLEIDADSFAMQRMSELVMNIPNKIDELFRNLEHPWEKIRGRLAITLISSMITARMLDRRKYDSTEVFKDAYPIGGYRLYSSLMMAGELWPRAPGVGTSPFPYEFAISVLVGLENAIDEATGVPGKGGNFRAAIEAVNQDKFLDRFNGRWAELYPELTRLKLGRLNLAKPQI